MWGALPAANMTAWLHRGRGRAWLVYRVRSGPARSDRPGQAITARPAVQLPPDPRPQLEGSHKPVAIGAGREVHLHLNVTPGQLAAIMRHYTEER
jgi:hypothetical protein